MAPEGPTSGISLPWQFPPYCFFIIKTPALEGAEAASAVPPFLVKENKELLDHLSQVQSFHGRTIPWGLITLPLRQGLLAVIAFGLRLPGPFRSSADIGSHLIRLSEPRFGAY